MTAAEDITGLIAVALQFRYGRILNVDREGEDQLRIPGEDDSQFLITIERTAP